MNVVLVYNVRSGSFSSLDDLKKQFQEASYEIIKTIQIKNGFEKKLQPFIKQKQTIATVGGDGTISAVANLLVGTSARLIPFPGGTLNHFTKDLGIPQHMDEALDYFHHATTHDVDVGYVNDHVFINNSSIGLYSDSLLVRDKVKPKIGKWPGVAYAVMKSLRRFHIYDVTVSNKSYKTPLVFIGNNRYEFEIADVQRKSIDKGELFVLIVKAQRRIDLVKAVYGFFHAKRSNYVQILHGENVTIAADRNTIRTSYDGEHELLRPPLKYKLQKKSLRVLYQ